MGVDTIARLKGRVSKEEILQFIQTHIDKDAFIFYPRFTDFGAIKHCSAKEYYGIETDTDKQHWEHTDCWFRFSENSPIGMIFYCYDNVNFYENLEYYSNLPTTKKDRLVEMVKSDTTTIMAAKYDSTTDVIKQIVDYFGGWYDEDDCDSNPFVYIEGERKEEG